MNSENQFWAQVGCATVLAFALLSGAVGAFVLFLNVAFG